ncbi:DUF418 domain-containing protein [Microbacterium sp. 4R-513]|uniref:DUF418 domain-containing protein n=1 Tax=Microbacterium sp. 4R-513 TaxID=2567934 RepID=UPI001F4A0204|nr:DUF418 domain-containing protein [Microbacterium sp. 4R-513]
MGPGDPRSAPHLDDRRGSDLALILGWHYPFTVWIAFVLAGMGVARAGVRSLAVQVRTLLAGAILALVGYGLHVATGTGAEVDPDSPGAAWTALPHSSGVLEVVGSGGFALAVLGGCLLLCRTPVVWIVLPLRATGAMPLTAYAAQILVWAAWAGSALGDTGALTDFRALAPFLPIALGVIAGCTAWALLVGRGPLEWTTDRLARLLVPGRAPATAPDRLER